MTWEPTTRTQELTKYLYRAPEPKYVIPFILMFSLLFGLLIDLSAEGLTYGFLFIALPAFLSAWTSTPFVEALGGKFYFRRSFLTSFVGVLILGFMLFFGRLIQPLIDVDWRYLLIYGYSLVLSMRYLVIRSTCLNYNRYSFVISSAQTFFAFVIHFLVSYNDLGYLEQNNFLAIEESLFGILSSLCIFISSLLFIEIVNAPLKTDVGISGTDLLGYFLSYMIEGTKEIETLFLPLQETFNIPFSILAVRNAGASHQPSDPTASNLLSESNPLITTSDPSSPPSMAPNKPFDAIIIAPSIHPGPVGTIGGGDLPSKLAIPLADLADHILVPHGAATNDNNLSTSEECDKIVLAVRSLAQGIKDADFTDKVSGFHSESNETTIHMLRFGKKGLIISEPRPVITDDIALEMFKTFSWAARYHGLEDLMVIDAHNNAMHGGSPVHVGDRISIEMEAMVNRLLKEEPTMDSFSLGFGSSLPDHKLDGLGPKGVETMIMKSHGTTTAFILYDGNNMVGEIREAIEKEAKKSVDRVLVLTADNHEVNATLGGFNPLGQNCSVEDLMAPMVRSVRMALGEMHTSEVAIKSGEIEGINILGFGNTQRLVATINSSVAILKRAAIPCTLLAITSSALMYYIV